MEKILEKLLSIEPYSLDSKEKDLMYKDYLQLLSKYHYSKCPEYKKIMDAYAIDPNRKLELEQQPMIPVRLFKDLELRSVSKEDVVKIMTSSGTTGQKVSKIYLDKNNVKNQTAVLTQIISSIVGKKRLPFLILDSNQLKKDRKMFSARGAGIIGFSMFGYDITYALDEEMNIRFDVIEAFLKKHQGETILLCGFTFIIWQHIIEKLKSHNKIFEIENGILFHMGGWKKLKDQAVDANIYNQQVKEVLGNITVYNNYGMIEQLGSIYIECEYGHMHCSNYSNIIIRNPNDFSVCEFGEKGLIEVFSLLPTSYPGHIILTEDEGEIIGEDDCPCGRRGNYFKIHGRIKGAEIRGCSDTYEKH